jgi:hypothetical protein
MNTLAIGLIQQSPTVSIPNQRKIAAFPDPKYLWRFASSLAIFWCLGIELKYVDNSRSIENLCQVFNSTNHFIARLYYQRYFSSQQQPLATTTTRNNNHRHFGFTFA